MSDNKKDKDDAPDVPSRTDGTYKRRRRGPDVAHRLPKVTPHTRCRLRLLKQERIKDFLLLEEEFIQNQQRLKPTEDMEKEEQTKVDDLRGTPMSVGNLEEIVDENHAIVSSSVGSEYYVAIMSFVDKDALSPGTTVLLHHKVFFVCVYACVCGLVYVCCVNSMNSTSSGGEREIQRTMLELLTRLDGFDSRGDVKVIMATNRIDALDTALIRPGRIDRKIEFPLPDEKTKRRIFSIHTSKMTVSDDVDLEEFVMSKDDLSGADIKAICTEAGLLALRERRMKVTSDDFRKAKENVLYRKQEGVPQGLYI
ncbi:26S proteasome subunit ATPase 4 [Salpingoeca rosetta]|uniref:26S proteasome subunit ATPase 4 n=1 Tax=Salpingoeca rosetta (strain ATCC 50818 / BSB-021) TaxID=946362 RepID=F2UMM8_SALR5|nr:26S proteasome subunit ATPase 4 [Salpingoeca rosetta]EGD78377.1 26S proteasome subunit ATPase 4 [Salpingoeca rosetta]|eukprot:XP_004989700.1 26S proteasome subunit ATPase 4 [Salpingoeca rosetta]